MADFIVHDRPQELWFQIEQLHLSYLQTEEIPEKIDQRKKLEGIIWEYLCLVPHERKFHFRETANVLHRSASAKEDFSGYRAASAWNAIGLYASNLLSHPWRKEYRELELYNGFYKHEIEANLVGAEVMLEEMGYKHTSQMTMVLDWPMDPDRVSYVSRDSLVAFVECQLLMRIWEEVSCHAPCSWLDVLEFRESHAGSWELAVRGLLYRYHQRQCEQHQVPPYHPSSGMEMYGPGRYQPPTPNCMYGQVPPLPHLNYCGYTPYMSPTHSYTLPLQARYSPSTALPPAVPYAIPPPIHNTYHPIPPQPVLKPQDLYPTNGHHAHHHYPAAAGIPTQVAFQNGYGGSHQLALTPQTQPTNYGCAVPTGQLIELEVAAPPQSSSSDTQQISSATDSSSSVLQQPRSHRQSSSRKNGTDKVRNQNSEQLVVKNVKDDGTGTFDSWDYVYRNLESQGYSKDLGERPDILSPPFKKSTATLPNNLQGNRTSSRPKTTSIDLEEALMEMRLEEYNRKISSQPEPRALKINEALQQIRLEGDGEPARTTPARRKGDLMEGTDSVYDNMSSPPKEKSMTLVNAKSSSLNQSKNATKTLPREFVHSSSNNKRDVGMPSATLDSRRMSERTKQQPKSSTNTVAVEANIFEPDLHRNEPPLKRLQVPVQAESESDEFHSDTGIGETKWQCITCTFLNASLLEICEMCGKSKNRGPEVRPLASGGRECPQCTLVNEKGIDTCEACGSSLKDSPTYI